MTTRFRLAAGALALGLTTPCAHADTIYVNNNTLSSTSGQILSYSSTGSPSSVASMVDQPYDIVRDAQGDFFTDDTADGTIYETTPDGTSTLFASGLSSPHGMAIDAAGNLFVGTGSTVTEVSAAGVPSTFDAGFGNAWDCTFDNNGNLFVSDLTTQKVYRYTGEQGSRSLFTQISVSANAGDSAIYFLTFDQQNDLFVSRQKNADIIKVTPTGVQSIFASNISGVLGLVEDHSNILFATTTNSVIKFAPSGTLTVQSTFARGLTAPEGIAVPEPSGAALLLGGLGGMGLRRLRRKPLAR